MPDQFGLLEVPLAGGLDQKTDPRKVQPGKLLTATNVQRLKDGAYAKRYGVAALTMVDNESSGGTALGGALGRLATRGDELLLMHRYVAAGGQGFLYTYATQAARWRKVDRLPEFTARTRPIASGAPGAFGGDVAYNATNKLLCFTWFEPTSATNAAGNVMAVVVDETTGTIVSGPTQLTSTGYSPRVLDLEGKFVVVFTNGANTISARLLPQTTYPLAWGSATVLRNNAAGTLAYFDVAKASGSSNFFLLYEVTGGAGPMRLDKYDNTLTRTNTADSAAAHAGIAGCALDVSSDSGSNSVTGVWFRYTGGNEIVSASWFNASTCAETVATYTVSSIAFATSAACNSIAVKQTSAALTAQVAWCASEDPGTVGAIQIVTRTAVIASDGTVTGTNRALHHAILASRIMQANNTTHAICIVGGYAGTGYGFGWGTHLLDLTGSDTSTASLLPRSECHITPRLATNYTPVRTVSSFVTDTNSRYRVVVPAAYASGVRTQIADCELDPINTTRTSAELGGLMYISGGVPSWYDGTRVGEIGFFHGPATVAAATVPAGGALDNSATYRYGIIYCQVDANGQVHRGDPFYVAVSTGAGPNVGCAITISLLSLTSRQDTDDSSNKPFIEIYRSEGNATATLYRLTAEQPFASGVTASSSGTMQNNKSADCITYTDETTDANLVASTYGYIGKPFIYTQGNGASPGQLDNVCPPSSRVMCVHRNRLWLAGCPDGKQLWPSKKQVANEPVGFSDGLVFYVDGGGEITALASMDDKLLVFKEDRIFYITGDGPADSGLQNDWSEPVPVNCTVGCTEPNSVVATPVGVIFQSSSGLCLVDRGLNVNALFGAPVADELSGYTITSAVLMPDRTEVRFGMINTAESNGKELRYDYRLNEWTIAKYNYSAGTGAYSPMRHAIVSRGVYHFVNTTPTVYKEDTSLYTDAGNFVSYTLEWTLAAAGTLGYQDAREAAFLMEGKTQGYVTVSADYDGLGAYTETKTWSNDGTASGPVTDGGTHLGEYVLTLALRRAAKSRRVKLKITDSHGGGAIHTLGTGRGSDIIGLALRVAQKEGPYKNVASTNKG